MVYVTSKPLVLVLVFSVHLGSFACLALPFDDVRPQVASRSLQSAENIRDSCWPLTFHNGVRLTEIQTSAEPGIGFDDLMGNLLLDLDGQNDYVQLAPTHHSRSLTITARIFARSAKRWSRILEMSNGMETDMILFGFSGTSGKLTFESFANGRISKDRLVAPSPLPLNQWVHVAAVVNHNPYGASSIYLYQDGMRVAEGRMASLGAVRRWYTFIGKSIYPHDEYFDGQITELRVYESRLFDVDITALANYDPVWTPGVNARRGDPAIDLDRIRAPEITFHGGARVVPLDDGGQAVDFDGTSGYVDLGSNTMFGGPTTITAWIYQRSSETFSRIIEMSNGFEEQMMFLGTTNYQPLSHEWWKVATRWMAFQANDENSLDELSHREGLIEYGPDSFPLNQWVHVALTLEDTQNDRFNLGWVEAKLYQDGILQGVNYGKRIRPYSSIVSPTPRRFNYLGRGFNTTNEYFDGLLRDLRIYPRALTSAEVLSIAQDQQADGVQGATFWPSACAASDAGSSVPLNRAWDACDDPRRQSVPGTCFFTAPHTATWVDAKQWCERRGGVLAKIESRAAMAAVHALYRQWQPAAYGWGGRARMWIGATDASQEGYFKWSDGSALAFTGWGRDEPNNFRGDEDCVEIRMWGSPHWNDNTCSHSNPFVCSKTMAAA